MVTNHKLAAIIFSLLLVVFSRCLAFPLETRVGVVAGWNHCVLDFDENGNVTGSGLHGGIGIGFDIVSCFAVNITPQIKSSSYIDDHEPGTNYHFTNLFVPATVIFKPFAALSNSPYLGLGAAMNIQLDGKEVYTEWNTEQPIEDLENDVYVTACIGVENRIAQFRISPEVSFHYNITPSHPGQYDTPVSMYDFHLTIGFYYAM